MAMILALVAPVFAGFFNLTGDAAQAAPGDRYPLTRGAPLEAHTAGLYASSGGTIFEYVGIDDPRSEATTELVAERTGAPYYWSSNLGIGRTPTGTLAFYGNSYGGGSQPLFKLEQGASEIEEIAPVRPSPTGGAWGGAAVSPDNSVWFGTNLASTSSTRVARYDPTSGESRISGQLRSTVNNDVIWNGGGTVLPDYAFDVVGNLYGLVYNAGQLWIYRYNEDTLTGDGAAMTVTPIRQVTGPAAGQTTYLYGFAWADGAWFAANGNGLLYRIDPQTGTSVQAGRKTTPATYDYALTDLASFEIVDIPDPTPALNLRKSASATQVTEGGTVSYALRLTNSGGAPAIGASVTDDLSDVLDDATFDDASLKATSGQVVRDGQTLRWTGDVAVGATVEITFSVTTNVGGSGNGVLENSATSPTSNCDEAVLEECSTATTVSPQPVPNVSIAKTASAGQVRPGEQVTYTLRFTNSGQADATGVRIDDDLTEVLDDAVFNDDASATSGTTSFDEPLLTWTGDIPAGSSVEVTFSVTVNEVDTGDATLTNYVFSDGTNCETPAASDPNCRTETAVVPAPTPRVSVMKSADATTVTAGDVVTYTITVTNSGDADAEGASVTDDLSAVLDDATFNEDAQATSGEVTREGNQLTWTGEVPAGESVTITYSVTTNDPVSGDGQLRNVMTSPGSNCESGEAPGCSTTTTITDRPVADVNVVKSADATTVTAGDVVSYTITVTNTGDADAPAATVTDDLSAVLDDATFNDDAHASSGEVTRDGDQLTWTGDVPAGGTVTITYSVTTNDPVSGDGSMTNSVVSEGTNCAAGDEAGCTSTTTVTDRPVADVSVVKSADATTVTAGNVVTYTITVDNTGDADATERTVTDDLSGVLDDAVFNDDAQATSGTVTREGNQLTWTGDVPAGESVTITYSVTTNNPISGDGQLGNAVTSPESNCESGEDPLCSTSTTVVPEPVANVDVSKSADATTVTAGDVVSYTITVDNTGNADATQVSVTDDLSGVLDDATFNDDAQASSGEVSRDGNQLTWTGDVPAGGTVTITYSVTTNDPVSGDGSMSNSVVSEGTNCAQGDEAGCTSTTTVTDRPVANVNVVKSADATTVTAGDVVTYTITVTNTGDADAPAATVTDDLSGVLDDATFNDDAQASSGEVTRDGNQLTWTGDVPAGESVTITYSVTTNDPVSGDGVLENAVTSDGTNCVEGDEAGCTSSTTVTDRPVANVNVAKSADATTVTAGDVVTYTITVTNTGDADAPAATVTDDLSAVLDDATFNDDAQASSGEVTRDGDQLTWTGDVPAGGTVTITYSVTTNDPVSGDGSMTNSVVSEGTNCAQGDEAGCTSTTTVTDRPVADVNVVKSADATTVTAGDVVSYTITVTNTGDADAPAATVTDDLSAVLDDATFNDDAQASSGEVTRDGNQLTWTGDVPAGGTVTITYSVTTNDPVSGDGVLENAVTSDDTNCAEGDEAGCTSTTTVAPKPAANVSVAKSADATTVTAGDVVSYTITVTNTGDADAPATTVTDDLSSVLDDATFNDDAQATSGEVTRDGNQLTWTGDVPAGGTVTITYSVTTNDPVSGDGVLENAVTSDDTNCAEGDEAGCTSTTTVAPKPAANVSVAKSADATTVTAGDVVSYTITVTNTGDADAPATTVTDDLSAVLDDATFNDDAQASSGEVTRDGNQLTWTGDVPAGGSVTITYSVTTNDPVSGDGSMTNSVVSDGTNCAEGDEAGCTSTTTVTDRPVADVNVVKSADATTVTAGDVVSYTITVTNTGDADAPETTVTDDLSAVLDDATFNDDAEASSGEVTREGNQLTWTGDVPAGGSVTITYSVTTNDPVSGDGSMTNSVVSEDTNCAEGDEAGCTSTTTVAPKPAANVSVAKSADATTVTAGDVVSYTITVTNTGDADAPATTVTDDLSSVLDDATFNDDAQATSGEVTRDGNQLTWTGDVPAGGTVTITYSVTTNDPVSGDGVLENAVISDGTNCVEGDEAGCTSTTTVTDRPAANVSVSKSADATTVTAGDVVSYTITVTNTGDADAPETTVTDDLSAVLDDATFNDDAEASSGEVTREGNQLTWTGDVPAGGSVTITYSVTTNDPVSGDGSMTNSVVSEDTNCAEGDEAGCTSTTTVAPKPAANVSVAKSADATSVTAGDVVSYTITVTNTGDADAPETTVTDDLSGVLDDATFNDDAEASSGEVTRDGDQLTWTGDVPAGGTVTITYSVTTNDPVSGDGSMSNSVVSEGTNCAQGDEAGCTSTTTVTDRPVANVNVVKSADATTVTAGDRVTYTITVTNTGDADAPETTVTDDLSAVLDDATFNDDAEASSGEVTRDGDQLTWTGDVPAGGTVTITYSVTTNDPVSGDGVLENAVTSDGTNCAEGDEAGCTSTTTVVPAGAPDVVIEKKASTASASPGDTVTYTVTVSNRGDADASDVQFTDNLSAVLDDATWDDRVDASAGDARFDAPELQWSGDVAAGESVTITYSVTTNDPADGDRSMVNTVVAKDSNCLSGGEAGCSTITTVTDEAVPDVVIVKTVSDTRVSAGDAVTYTVTFSNRGDADATGRTFTDDLSDVLDDAVFNDDAQATSGEVTREGNVLTWTGDIPAGKSVTITYSVTTNDPADGDRNMVNAVVSKDTNCGTGEEPPCSTVTVVEPDDDDNGNPGPGDPGPGPGDPGGPGPGELPRTGTDVLIAVLIAAALLALGIVLFRASARVETATGE